MQHTFPLKCAHCDLPWAHIQNGSLIVDSRHGGQLHTNAIALPTLHVILSLSLTQEVGPLVCRVDACGRPWAIPQTGRLFCYVWHSRDHHQNLLSVSTLAAILSAITG